MNEQSLSTGYGVAVTTQEGNATFPSCLPTEPESILAAEAFHMQLFKCVYVSLNSDFNSYVSIASMVTMPVILAIGGGGRKSISN